MTRMRQDCQINFKRVKWLNRSIPRKEVFVSLDASLVHSSLAPGMNKRLFWHTIQVVVANARVRFVGGRSEEHPCMVVDTIMPLSPSD